MSSSTTRFLMLLNATAAPSPILRRHFSSFLRHRHRLSLSLSPSSRRFPPSFRHFHSPTAAALSPPSSTPSFPYPPEHHHSSSHHHPWPEWSSLLDYLSSAGYFGSSGHVAFPNLPEGSASACLSFARHRVDILGMLPRREIEVVVEKGAPFLFEDSEESVRRMRLFLMGNALDGNDRAEILVDLMKYSLSYASNAAVSSESSTNHDIQLVELSVRNLLLKVSQLGSQDNRGVQTNESVYNDSQELYQPGSGQNRVPDGYRHTARPFGQNVEMKRGDWICPRCSFMNFARNVKCLECEEARPKRQLTGGEWECPQCDFYNYGRNMVCLRCDCKRPGDVSLGTNINDMNRADTDSQLATNEEKAKRWFSKVPQLDSASDVNGPIADEDFPDIMPLRKGVNRFVVSTRKTPLERRLADAQHRRNLNNWGTSDSYGHQNTGGEKTIDQTISQKLDKTLGLKSSGFDNMKSDGHNAGTNYSSVGQSTPSYGATRETSPSCVPFVPLPADMFAKKPENPGADGSDSVEMDKQKPVSLDAGGQIGTISQDSAYSRPAENWKPVEQPRGHDQNNMGKEQAKKSGRWFERIAELHNVTDSSGEILDGDFPDIMPMRKGENRFVVSKRKDRSLTSPSYKRYMAQDPANATNYVPFVPFPPNYFAQKDKQKLDDESIGESLDAAVPENAEGATELPVANVPGLENQQSSTENCNSRASGQYSNDVMTNSKEQISRHPVQNTNDSVPSGSGSWIRQHSVSGSASGVLKSTAESLQNVLSPLESGTANGSSQTSLTSVGSNSSSSIGKTSQPSDNANMTSHLVGTSLEGSQVKEPDPLDMSEEAKAERWFRRVAQIKDISELSQIPDEDFPSIMPMRKGVNRFVVSKRKTPLERRLASTQYRRNLPTVSSNPAKENDGRCNTTD